MKNDMERYIYIQNKLRNLVDYIADMEADNCLSIADSKSVETAAKLAVIALALRG